ncbi:hypothetical protein [Aneurinibacillus sp. UBA3580]|jgi:ABC-2 type transport system permease protein|uniref:hypothetical protein n=1 Tax=Aneurinibacillus sp. UBA3580 TaxID=1946041 RepID=UPI00257FE64E|nr:hypothetical protein [Aneurinibacillus sp. UBA3580]
MFNHALWMKEYRQAKPVLWMLPVICLLFMGVARGFVIWNKLIPYEGMYNRDLTAESFYSASYGLLFMRNCALAGLIVLLATSFIGMERRNLLNDFTFSLPFSRRRIFMVKWGIGVTFLAASLFANEVVDALVILLSPFSDHFNVLYHIKDFAFTIIVLTGLYTFALFVGTVTGSAFAQAILTAIFSIFPVGFMTILMFFVYVNFRWDAGHVFSNPIFQVMMDMSLFFHVVGIREGVENAGVYIAHMWGPLLYTALFLPLGLYCYQRNRLEYNGRIILFRQLQAVFKAGVALCFALAIGMFFTILFVPDLDRSPNALLLPYYFGFIGGGLVTLIVMERLMKVRLKV